MKVLKNKWVMTLLRSLSLVAILSMSASSKDDFGDNYLPVEIGKTVDAETLAYPKYTTPLIPVTFHCEAQAQFGENIYITGSVSALGNWSIHDALLLSNEYYPIWTITVNLPANTLIEYKYIRIYNGLVSWESDPVHTITTPASGTCTVNDVFHY